MKAKIRRRTQRTLIISEMAICISLAFVLNEFLPFFRGPNGGSITLAPVPLFVFAFKRGAKFGALAGFIMSTLKIAFKFYIPPNANFFTITGSALLDYVIPYVAFGVAPLLVKNKTKKQKSITTAIGVLVTFLIKEFSRWISFLLIWTTTK
ncbi:MAG: energy-coupled thiamine transporter ThiT [Oscillospiraceae bacterium]|jgi:thiamine transporter ThiT|nr:energy-coupled thiamine transporter ThiT [Oscillospiraceae bacterium]